MRLLVVGMPFSIHVVRWLSLLENSKWEVHFFSSFPYKPPHAEMKNVIYHDYFYNYWHDVDSSIKQNDVFNRKLFLRNKWVAKWVGKGFRFLKLHKEHDQYLKILIKRLQPDIVHTMESQHGGYMVSRVLGSYRTVKPVWVHTTFGIDLDYFKNFSEHNKLLRKMFSGIDVYIAEGIRDINYSKELGFNRQYYIFPSAGGGYIIEDFINRNYIPPSARKRILVKGYQDSVRRGLVAIRALVKCKELIRDYEVLIYSCAPEVVDYIEYVNTKEEMNIKILSETNYQGWLNHLSLARISITNNLSDGIPSSFFESLLMGVFPIQSESSCTDEWFENNVTGMLVSPEDSDVIEQAIRRALTNDQMVDNAAKVNIEKVSSALEFNKVRDMVLTMYDEVVRN